MQQDFYALWAETCPSEAAGLVLGYFCHGTCAVGAHFLSLHILLAMEYRITALFRPVAGVYPVASWCSAYWPA